MTMHNVIINLAFIGGPAVVGLLGTALFCAYRLLTVGVL